MLLVRSSEHTMKMNEKRFHLRSEELLGAHSLGKGVSQKSKDVTTSERMRENWNSLEYLTFAITSNKNNWLWIKNLWNFITPEIFKFKFICAYIGLALNYNPHPARSRCVVLLHKSPNKFPLSLFNYADGLYQ